MDGGLKLLSTAANHSVLWCGVALILAARKGPARRGALRGLAAIAGASALTNVVAKPLFPRRRPAAELVATRRRLANPPSSSSFPSGHSASAAAFATAVAMEQPVAGLLVAPVAAAVSYSRVHTGVHWPSDVLAGAALGVGVGLATRRWWPVRPEQPGRARPSEHTNALVDGEGLLLLVNPFSGDGGDDRSGALAEVWPSAKIIHPVDGTDLIDQLDEVVRSRGAQIRAIGVAGGDGTVAAAASVAATHGLPLAVVPAGTLNHFARDLGVDSTGEVVRAVAAGDSVRIDLAAVGVDGAAPRMFVNTASIGGYPEMVRLRERKEDRWGKWPAAAWALMAVLSRSEPLDVRLNGVSRRVWLLFVGNGGYQPKGFAPSWRPRLDDGLLDLRYLRADLPFSRTRFVLQALTGALEHSRVYQHAELAELDVQVAGRPVSVATDGEVLPRGRQFRFTAHYTVLDAYRSGD